MLARHVVYVTGGGQGLGRATALHLARLGARVVVADISEKAATAVQAEIGGGHLALASAVDVTSEAQVRASIDETVRKFGSLTAVVNCAGILSPGRVLSQRGPADLEAFQRVLSVNVSGTFNVIRLAAERMALNTPDRDGGRGCIINTASIAAMDGQIGQTAYAASKGAIAAMTLPLSRDLSSYGIRCMCIAPGLFSTPMLAELPEPIRQGLASSVPFPRRLGDPEEFAKLAVSILENPYLNGEVIRLDGALRMAPQ